jgi:glycosyltransferase involved in cell wall biosynthesis
MLTRNLVGQVPVILATDSTPSQLRAFAEHYNRWGGRSDRKFQVRERLYAACLRRAAAVQAWSEWAARSLRDDYGVPASRVHVLPPGVDTDFWSPRPRQGEAALPRILFVGGDFRRKGGDLLLEVFRSRFAGRAELHLVTRPDAARSEPGVHLHSGFAPNDAGLPELYRQCDVLAIPTQADCFSMAGLEAMACGLPVVTCPVGGVSELFSEGREGLFVPAADGVGLAAALDSLLSQTERRRRMGRAARELVLRQYDARANTRRLLALIEAIAG